MRTVPAAALLLLLLAPAARAEVAMPPVFSDGMVLQRDAKCPVWGTAAEGEKVRVAFRGKTAATAAKDGKWRVDLESGEAGGPFVLTVEGANKIEIKGVYCGDVWLISGQSNSSHPNQFPADQGSDSVRLFSGVGAKPGDAKKDPTDWLGLGKWITSGKYSMFGWYFAHHLHAEEQVPIGMLQASWGGTAIEKLIPRPAGADPKKREWRERGAFYERLVKPLEPYRIKGVIFWQGESNLPNAPEYYELFPKLIRDWRAAWGQGDFPFIYVQLERLTPKSSIWFPKQVEAGMLPVIWDAQRKALAEPNTAMVQAFDVSGAIHPGPKEKEIICRRAVAAARALACGRKDLEWSGPLLEKAELRGDEVALTFAHAEGLSAREVDAARETWTAQAPAGDGKLKGFEIQPAGGRFLPAGGRMDGRTVFLSAKGLKPPLKVRYAWKYTPDGNLYNRAGLPASPFLTDVPPAGGGGR